VAPDGVVMARRYRARNSLLAAVWMLAAVMVIAGLIESPGPAMRWTGVLELVIGMFGFSGLGVLIVVRARNPIGWFFCAAGLLMAYQYWLYVRQPAPLIEEWLAGSIVYIGLLIAIPALILVFPDGRLPSRRWRPVWWLGAGVAVGAMLSTLFAPILYGTNEPTPFAGVIPDSVLAGLDILSYVLVVPFLIAVVASPIVRYRRAAGAERLQLKMFGYGAALAVVLWSIPQIIDAMVARGPTKPSSMSRSSA
jgi:hypothetical protein